MYVDCNHQHRSGQGRSICSRDSHHECRGYPVRKDTKTMIKREDVACTEEVERAMFISLPEVGKKHLELLAEGMHREKRKRPFSF